MSLTDRILSRRYERTLGATPSAETFARARALSTSRVGAVSLAASPTGTGTDAAGEAMGAPGSAVPASPTVHQLPCQVAHFHLTRDERAACEAEHAVVMWRLSRLGVA